VEPSLALQLTDGEVVLVVLALVVAALLLWRR
jgi:hypothetical protein